MTEFLKLLIDFIRETGFWQWLGLLLLILCPLAILGSIIEYTIISVTKIVVSRRKKDEDK